MGSDGAGWFAVLDIAADGTGPRPPVPVSALARIAADVKQAGVVLQVVLHSSARPGSRVRDNVVWVAVRVDS